ncbi:MAG: HAMP domain-containing protein [Alphaproteobacteria bacterium]|nr:HAMP domain-containing protein [Alphaproteobacteria bacterium]
MIYLLITQIDGQVAFTQKEIAGVHYIAALQQGLVAATDPNGTPQAMQKAASAIATVQQQDGNVLGLEKKAQVAEDALNAGKKADAISALSDAIGVASDNSNITLDPDTDAYYVGDMLVNQGPGILVKTAGLAAAAHDLIAQKTDVEKMAFAVAHDELLGAGGNFASDMGKAIKGNSDGKLEGNIAVSGNAVTEVGKIIEAANDGNYAAIGSIAPGVISAISTAFPNLDAEMIRLLEARIHGFRSTLFDRIGVALLFILFGGAAFFFIVRSITRPVAEVVKAMGQITAGNLDVTVPSSDRHDEIGKLIQATESFYDATRKAAEAKAAEEKRTAEERRRAAKLVELNQGFSASVKQTMGGLGGSVTSVDGAATAIADGAQSAAQQAAAIAAAAQQASSNVQTVAAASEELTASIQEIAARIQEAGEITGKATKEAGDARTMVGDLSDAANKIGEVIDLITEIASQTNLLALNATIEAARAGEAGKGFAVVASEVKALANQTSRATEDISGHIHAIQEAVNKVIEAIKAIESTIGQVNSVSATIASAIEEQSAATQEISRNVQEAATGTSDVTANVTRVASMIEQTRNGSVEVLTAVKLLQQESSKLGEDINKYISDVSST